MPYVIFNGPEGRIEGRYRHGRRGAAPIAIILHPLGGSMNNKVVHSLYQAFTSRGFSTLRFNFRGVGRSEGQPGRGEGELSDAAAALDWLQTYNPNAPSCWVAGYSFGAWIGMQLLMRRPEIESFVSVSPPAGHYDFNFLAPCPSSGLIVHGARDDLVHPKAVENLVKKLSFRGHIKIDFCLFDDANHAFLGHTEALADKVGTYIDNRLTLDINRS